MARPCIVCGTSDFDDMHGKCNVCPSCNGSHDADLLWHSYSKASKSARDNARNYYIGDLSELSPIERVQFMTAFNSRLLALESKNIANNT